MADGLVGTVGVGATGNGTTQPTQQGKTAAPKGKVGGSAAGGSVGLNGAVVASAGLLDGGSGGQGDVGEGGGEGATGQDGQTAKAPPKPAARVEPTLHEVTVDGKSLRVTTEQLVQLAQKADGANRRFQEASKTEKLAERLLSDLQSDPDKVLAAIGVDTDKFWQERLAAKAKQEMLSPEERARRQLEQERDGYKQRLDQAEQQRSAEKRRALDEQISQSYERDMVGALERAGLRDPGDLQRMAELGIEALELGLEMTPDQLATEVAYKRSEQLGGLKSHLSSMEGPALVDFLGKDLVKKVLRATLEGVRRPGQEAAKAQEAVQDESPRKPIGTVEMNKNLRKLGIGSNIFLG